MNMSSGMLECSADRLVVLVDPELHRYFRSQVPKTLKCQLPRYAPHITVIRNEPFAATLQEEIKFVYYPVVQYDGTYWWLNCYSDRLIEIRRSLGLPAMTELTRPPDGSECFHTTIGNSKGV